MKDKIDTLLGWHFCTDDKRLNYNDGRKIIEGKTLRVEGNPVLCENGLHASERIIDALKYAPGPILCRIKLFDSIVRGKDKAVARERKTLWMFDATNALRDFAATIAEQALMLERAAGREPDPRSWAAVQFVRDLLAGKVKERGARRAAAWSAALTAARSAWLRPAKSAWLRSAAESAAWTAAESVVWSAAESAAATAARAAYSAAESAAWSATATAATATAAKAAYSAAESAAHLAAESAQNDLLLQIIDKWRNK